MTERMFLGLLTPSEILAILTLVLVAVTAYYAWQTRRTVVEMRKARASAVLPRVMITIKALGAQIGWPQITNVGVGPAIDVRARMTYLPGGPEVVWRAHVLAPGEVHQLFAPDPDSPGQVIHHLDKLVKHYSHIRLVATYRDALGEAVASDETFEIREWWQIVQDAKVRLPHDPAEETVKELTNIGKQLKSLADDLKALRQRDEKDPWRWEYCIRRLPPRLQPPARRVLGLLRVA
jgi:hypothetical protein